MIDFYAIFYYIHNIRLNYLTSVLASVEAYRELEVAYLVWSFRGDLNSTLKSFELDLGL